MNDSGAIHFTFINQDQKQFEKNKVLTGPISDFVVPEETVGSTIRLIPKSATAQCNFSSNYII
jgi:hypothetical protein